jgi:hypothetical protein
LEKRLVYQADLSEVELNFGYSKKPIKLKQVNFTITQQGDLVFPLVFLDETA